MLYSDSFKSIGAFVEWLDANDAGRPHPYSEDRLTTGFTMLRTYDEAKQLLLNGWNSKAEELVATMKAKFVELSQNKGRRPVYDVVGHQASVPRYLQGVPTNMVRNVSVPKRQKVVTLVKVNSYNAGVTSDEVLMNSAKALQIVMRLESMGYDVNLDLLACSSVSSDDSALRVRVKSSSERINISKVAFPMVHPDMFRRLVFRYRENKPQFKTNYTIGSSNTTRRILELNVIKPGEYLLEAFIGDIDETIQKMALR